MPTLPAGFMLLAAGDDELPEGVSAARLQGRSINDVESADLAYFGALRVLDLSDNRVGAAPLFLIYSLYLCILPWRSCIHVLDLSDNRVGAVPLVLIYSFFVYIYTPYIRYMHTWVWVCWT